MASSLQGLTHEMDKMNKRIATLERTVDSIATKDDVEAIKEAREDLKRGKTVSLAQDKKNS
jgi:hypothetical protein